MEIAIATFLILVTTGIGLYRWQRSSSGESGKSLPPPRNFGGLFPSEPSESEERQRAADETARKATELAKELLARSAGGDLTCLSEAQAAGGSTLYNEVLDCLMHWADGRQEMLRDIVSYIVKHAELRANKTLADSLVAAWTGNPDGLSAADVMHVAALADDGQVYLAAVDATVMLWREGKLPRLTAAQVHQLCESQYWVMSAEARASGSSFMLRQQLARIRDELARPPSGGPQ